MAAEVCAQQSANGVTPSASTTAPVLSVPAENPEAGAYQLRGGAIEASGNASSQTAVTTPYELPNTGISGSRGSSQVILTTPVPERGAPFRTENGIFLYPSVFVGYGYNDNVLSSRSNQLASRLVNISPQVMAEMKRHGDRYTAMVVANHTSYSNSSDDNYTSYEAWVAGDNYFTARARMGWTLGQVNSFDPRGGSLRPTSSSPDRWHAPTLRGRFIYGAPEAAGRIEIDVDTKHKRYDNNRTVTEAIDLDDNGQAGRFFYRLGSRSLAMIEASKRVFDYTSATATEDNTDRRLYLGYTWEATAATTGIVKFGRMTKRFVQTDRDQFSGSTWEATVRWLPRTYSELEFQSVKGAENSTGIGNYLLSTNNSIAWKNKWSSNFSTVATMGLSKSQYAGTSRADNNRRISFTVHYNFRRWLTLGADFANTDLQSTDPTAEWKRNVIMLTSTFTL